MSNKTKRKRAQENGFDDFCEAHQLPYNDECPECVKLINIDHEFRRTHYLMKPQIEEVMEKMILHADKTGGFCRFAMRGFLFEAARIGLDLEKVEKESELSSLREELKQYRDYLGLIRRQGEIAEEALSKHTPFQSFL